MADFRTSIDATSSIAAVQEEVIDSFRDADPGLDFRTTGYFNHTYVPDVVIRWPGQSEERQVFLRASDNEAYLREDIGLLNDKYSIFVPLNGLLAREDTDDVSGSADALLQEASVSAHALVTGPASIRALSVAAPQSERINSLSARAVLQGGAGVISPNFASSFNAAVAEGFRGALVGNEDATREALRLSIDVLDSARTAQLAELLQAAWVGGGQVSTDFPGLGLAGSPLEPQALLLLLDTVSFDDDEFWQRLSRNLEFKHFAGLTVSGENQGFQQLMRAAAPRLKAKAARTVGLRETEESQGVIWALNAGILSLDIGRARVDFAPRSVEEFKASGIDASPTVSSFVKRAVNAEINVLRVVLSNEDRSLEYASEDGTSVVNDERIQNIADEFDGSVVSRAVVGAEGRDLGINLETSTGFGRTRSVFYVSSLVRSLVPLIADLNEQERGQLVDVFDLDTIAGEDASSGIGSEDS
ncbi:hypothetical protein [Curtobacterium oceanosedimentum]|uniref:hypothetical protein n=1 Tax=Curtobacterium oceanosedimentum TaxID=465820 RepID=UPI0033966A7E